MPNTVSDKSLEIGRRSDAVCRLFKWRTTLRSGAEHSRRKHSVDGDRNRPLGNQTDRQDAHSSSAAKSMALLLCSARSNTKCSTKYKMAPCEETNTTQRAAKSRIEKESNGHCDWTLESL